MNATLSINQNLSSFRILPHMCAEQHSAMLELLDAADEIGAASAATCTQGGHGYVSLREARNNFKTLLESFMSKTRFCVIE